MAENKDDTYKAGEQEKISEPSSQLDTDEKDFTNAPIEELQLSRRAEHCLKKAEINTISDLLKYDKYALMKLPNLGAISAEEIISELSLFLQNVETSASREAYQFRPIDPLDTRIELLGLSIRPFRLLKELGVKTIKDLIETPQSRLMGEKQFGEVTLREIKHKLGNFLIETPFGQKKKIRENEIPAANTPDSLEGLISLLFSHLSAREKHIIENRFGIWSGKRKTLEEIGRELGVTRERIRQIQQETIRKLRCPPNKRIINAFFQKFFKEKVLPFMSEHNGLTKTKEIQEKLSRSTLDEEMLQTMVNFINEIFFVKRTFLESLLVKAEEGVFCLNEEIKSLYSNVVDIARKILEKNNAPLNVDDLISRIWQIARDKKLYMEYEFIKCCISIAPQTEKDREYVELKKWGFSKPKRVYEMAERTLIKIGQPAHFTQIALMMDKIFPEKASFKSNNVHAVLDRCKDKFVWAKPGVYGLASWGLKRPPYIKDYLVRLFKKANQPLHIDFLKEEVLRVCNCRENSILMTLDLNENLFVKYSNGFYGLQDNSKL